MATNDKNTLWIITAIVGGILVLGCGTCAGVVYFVYWGANKAVDSVRDMADREKRTNDLNMVGLAIHIYHDERRKMPAGPDDLAPYLENGPIVDRLRKKEIEVVWNAVSIRDEKRGSSNVIIGWDTKVDPGGQRLVLFLDRSVRSVSETEFQNTPKLRTVDSKEKNTGKN